MKKILKSMILLLVLATLFSGCSSNVDVEKQPVVESDVNANAPQVGTPESEVNTIVQSELVVDDSEVEIGDLI